MLITRRERQEASDPITRIYENLEAELMANIVRHIRDYGRPVDSDQWRLEKLGERSIIVDCDVIQADGGTRCASITGAYVALVDAVNFMLEKGMIEENPIKEAVCAISVGMTDAGPVLDLDYVEDSTSETDMNVVMTSSGRFIELQGTAEGSPFSHEDLTAMLALAKKGCEEILAAQKAALAA